MDAPAGDALLAEEALALVAANDAAMRAAGAASAARDTQLLRALADAAERAAAASPGAAVLLRSLHASLTEATQAGDAARGRARVACVCRAARAAADVSAASPAQRIVAHARARACAAIYADLARNKAALLGGAPALQRLCATTAPPPPACWCGAPHHDGSSGSGSGSGAAAVAAAWRMLAREVAAAAPGFDDVALLDAFVRSGRGGNFYNSHDKQLRYIGATPEEVAAGEALFA
jgi:hypothetical protein